MDNIEKELALYALRYAKDIISFLCSQMPHSAPPPPMNPINDTIKLITEGVLPWEKK